MRDAAGARGALLVLQNREQLLSNAHVAVTEVFCLSIHTNIVQLGK